MDSTGSYLYTLLARVRGYMDDPDVDAKYNDDFLIRHILCPTMVDVLSRLSMNQDNPVVLNYLITTVVGTDRYILPPVIGQVLRLVQLDEDGNVVNDAYPRHLSHPYGRGWAIEDHTLVLEPAPTTVCEIILQYVPNGDFLPHYSTGGTLALAASVIDPTVNAHRITLDATPNLGPLDRRPNAYAGQVIRLLPASPGVIEERTIATSYYSAGVWYAETNALFVNASVGTVTYEIAPRGLQAMYEAIAVGSALKLAAWRKVSQSSFQLMSIQYRQSMKTISDMLANLNGRTGKYYAKDTVDNPGLGFGIL